MTESEARKIGSRQALKSVAIGLFIARFITPWPDSGEPFLFKFFSFMHSDYGWNILAGAGLMFLFGHLFGRRAGVEILVNRRRSVYIGILYGFVILVLSTFCASLIGYFQEGINQTDSMDKPIHDYIFKPVYLVFLFGFIPVVLVGAWFGYSIKRREEKVVA